MRTKTTTNRKAAKAVKKSGKKKTAQQTPPRNSRFNVVLQRAGGSRINVIKVVREIMGLALKEAKDLVEAAPTAVREGVSIREADVVRQKLADAGAVVKVSPVGVKRKAVKAVKRAVKNTFKTPARAVPYVLKEKSLQVIVQGRPFMLDSTHPTFAALKTALQRKQWAKVPGLVTMAERLRDLSEGKVTVERGEVRYKGVPVEDGLTRYILLLLEKGEDARPALRAVAKLHRNPSADARAEFGTWLTASNLPICDDGDFLAYKSVDADLKDEYSHTIDNSPGQVILGSRSWFNTDYREQCSRGYHICDKSYGLYGKRILLVKASPADVLSAVGGKVRVVNYEVLRELGSLREDVFKRQGFGSVEGAVVKAVRAERKELLQMILKDRRVQRYIRTGKMARSTVLKQSFGQLVRIASRFGIVTSEKVEDGAGTGAGGEVKTEPRLRAARKAAGLTVGQVAKAMGIGYKVAALLEVNPQPDPLKADAYVEGIARAVDGGGRYGMRAVTFPRPIKALEGAAK
jgi:ribosomal protein L7/L12